MGETREIKICRQKNQIKKRNMRHNQIIPPLAIKEVRDLMLKTEATSTNSRGASPFQLHPGLEDHLTVMDLTGCLQTAFTASLIDLPLPLELCPCQWQWKRWILKPLQPHCLQL